MLLLSQGTPTAGTISNRSQVLQFDEREESDCDIEMIGEDSEDDVVNSETESEEDQRGMVDCMLNSVSPLSHRRGADWEMVCSHCKVEKEENIIHC